MGQFGFLPTVVVTAKRVFQALRCWATSQRRVTSGSATFLPQPTRYPDLRSRCEHIFAAHSATLSTISRMCAVTFASRDQETDEQRREQALLKYFSIAVAAIVGILAIISRWLPPIDLPLRVVLLTSISFGTTMIIKRGELKRPVTWTVLAIGALIHFIVLWAIRDRFSVANMWIVGACAIMEGLLLLVAIEMCKPPSERWNS